MVPPDGIKTWDLSSIVKYCTLIELSPRFQQEAKQRATVSKIHEVQAKVNAVTSKTPPS